MGANPKPRRTIDQTPVDENLFEEKDHESTLLDPIIHERMRLGIASALSVNESLTFVELKEMLSATDGNLSVHARKLEDAGYIRCTKSFRSRVPRTEYSLTQRGTREFQRYLNHMEALIKASRGKA